jgi:hypothetical protein
MVLMLIVVATVPCCCLPVTCYPDQSCHKQKITAQNYCPPCQLGKLPSSRISTDILALRAQNLQQLSASPDQKPQCQNSVLTASPKVLRKISAHSKPQSSGSLLRRLIIPLTSTSFSPLFLLHRLLQLLLQPPSVLRSSS